MNQPLLRQIALSAAILIGLLLLGFYIYKGLRTFSDKDRVVTVKGLAEIDMTATAATIEMEYSYSGDNLQELLQQSETKKNAILKKLDQSGFGNQDIKINPIDVTDREKYYETQWANNTQVEFKIDRYTVSQTLHVPSSDVTQTEAKVNQMKLDLIRDELTTNISTSYTFPDLNSIKPQLIAESTQNARVAGEQFANDSQAKLGKIKTASQGQITIAGRYYYDEDGNESGDAPAEPYLQKARVVSTIVFFLE
ncbi:MAG: SIMPL domain-containing protein [Flavobacteriales bacterium]